MVTSNSTDTTFTLPSDREIVMTRVFDAPRRLVFEACTQPEHMQQWWGPRGYSLPVCEIDLRVGGAYHFVNRGPDGVDYGFRGEYREIVPLERLVYTFEFEGMPGHVSVETLTFEDVNGKTRLTNTARFDSKADRDVMLESGMEQGARETWERLAEHLDTMGASDREVVVSRLLGAPRELVYAAWTDPARMVQWWGPDGFTTTLHEMDVRPGGVWRFVMHGPDGTDYPTKNVFVEVMPPERLVYDHGWDTEDAPVMFRATVTFAAEGDKTRLTMQSLFTTTAERDQVVRDFGAIEGAKQHLERLALHLAQR